MKKNKAIKIIIIVFIVLFIADLLSTLSVGLELVKALESNPLYPYIGLIGLCIINLLLPLALYYTYNHGSIFWRYNLLNTMVIMSIMRCWVVYNNLMTALNPPPLEVAQAIPQEIKTQYYLIQSVPFLIFIVVGILTYLLFRIDHYSIIKQRRQ